MLIENKSGATPGSFGPSVLFANNVASTNGFVLGEMQSGASEFYIANANSPYTEYLTVTQNGNIGIGTASPATQLSIFSGGVLLNLDSNQIWATTGSGGASNLYLNFSSSGATIINQNGGNVGIGNGAPSYLLHVGSASASGTVAEWQNSSGACTANPTSSALTISCTSDERLKKDIVDATSALPALTDMRVRDFALRATGERMTGVIAQEMQKTHADMVHKGPDGYYRVDAPNPWKLVKAIQELKADNDRLRAQIDRQAAVDEAHERGDAALRAELGTLEQRFAALKTVVTARHRTEAHSTGRAGVASRIRLTSNGN